MRPFRRSATLALALFASLLSCGRDLTGPGGRGSLVALQIAPDFSAMIDSVGGIAYSVAELVPFTKVRIELRRVDNSVAASTIVDFPATATELPLSVDVRLSAAAVNGTEPLTAFIRYINATGDTVFAGGPVAVTAQARRGEQPPPVQIPIAPTVPGAVFTSLEVSPDSVSGNSGTSVTLTATGRDGQSNVVSNAIIGFISRNPAIAAVPNLGAGIVNLVGARGETWIVAQSLTGLKDSTHVRVLAVPTQIAKANGDNQTALQNIAFAQPLRVRVLASDNLPVAGATVNFAVTAGGGSVSAATATTDIDGFASVIWTAGSTLGAASVTASVGTPAITTVFSGTQVNAGPTSMAFVTEPIAIVAGDTLPSIKVAVRNALGQTITSFTGEISLTRVGTGPGLLVGDTAAAAVAGVATFSGLTVTKPGTDYRLVAVLAGVPNQLSSTFPVTAAPPHAIQLISGGGQFADPSTVLAAPIVVRVIDVFGYSVVGTTVNFAVQSGDGSTTPTSATTDANGQASTSWTLGATGTQLLRVTAGPAPALDVSAQLNDLDGPPIMFAGVDSTLLRIGFSRAMPVYLSSRADTTVTGTLSTNNAALQWSASTATFAPTVRQLDLTLTATDALAPGSYWAYVTSAIGNDSIEVTVDSAFVMFTDLYFDGVVSGDTVTLPVWLSQPAPVGGQTVRVKSLDPAAAQLLKGTGAGPVVSGCLNPDYCNYSAIVIAEGTPDDSVDLLIPAGELMGHVAVLITVPPGQSQQIPLSVTAAKHRGDEVSFYTSNSSPYLNGQVDTIGVGLAGMASIYSNNISSTRDQRFQLKSLTPSIFTVDSVVTVPRLEYLSPSFQLRGLAAGAGLLEWGNSQVGYDTVSVTVVQPRITTTTTSTSAPNVSTRDVFAYLDAPGNSSYLAPLADVLLTATSLDTTIAVVETPSRTVRGGDFNTLFQLRIVGTGATKIVLTAPGFIPDTVDVTGSALDFTVNAGGGTLAVGTQMPWTVNIVSRTGDVGSPRRVQMQTRNIARARVVVQEFNITRGGSGVATFDVVGLSAGADTADFFLDNVYVRSVPFVVSSPKLLLNTGSVQTIDPDSLFDWTLPAYLADSLNVSRLAADTVRGTLRSSDPSVVLVTDSLLEIKPNFTTTTNDLQIVGVNPGTAIVTLMSPGFPDFVDTVTVRPRAILLGGQFGVGQGLLGYMTLLRNSATSAALPLTVTHQGPGRVDFIEPLTEFPASQDLLFEYIKGTTVGVDTVIVSAAGHVPDTVIYTVYDSRAELVADQTVSGGQTDEYVYASLRFGESSSGYDPAVTRRFRVTSSDTTRAKVIQDTILVSGPGSSTWRDASVRYGNAGPVMLIMTDLDGFYAPDTLAVTVTPRRLYGWTDWDENYLPIGVRQRSYDENTYVELGYYAEKDTWVRFTTSRPGLITIPDSVKIPAGEAYTYFNLAAGDTVGGVRVTASVPGYTPWEFDVAVTRSIIKVCECDGYVGADNYSYAYIVDALEEYSRPLAAATTLRFRSENSAIANVLQSDWTIPADSEYVEPRTFRGIAPGRTQVSVSDARGDVFSRFEPGYGSMEIRQPTLESRNTRYFATPGLETTGSDHIVDASAIRDSIWVRLTSANGRMLPGVDSVLVANDYSGIDESQVMSYTESSFTPFKLRGVSAGEDTLILNATGLPTHRVPVSVQPGVLRLAPNTPSVVTVGDSLLVTVNFAGADGAIGAKTTSNVTLNFGFMEPELRLSPSIVNAVDNALVVPPGATAASFWLKATGAGLATFEINSDSFRTLRITIEARNRP